jgi:hypothetical protein
MEQISALGTEGLAALWEKVGRQVDSSVGKIADEKLIQQSFNEVFTKQKEE